MTPLQNLHYAIGELAYAMACADGIIQKDEREKFQAIIAAELRCKEYNFNVSDIIFRILDKDRLTSTQTSYDLAMKEIKLNSHYLSPTLKETFIKVLEKVAKAFPPITKEEMSLLERFKKDIHLLKGDPVYYESVSKI